jgi:MFS family permease
VVPKLSAAAPAATAGTAVESGGVWRLWPLLLMIFVLHIMMMMGNTQVPFVFSNLGLKSASTIALVAGITAPLGGVASIASGYLQAKFGERSVLCGAIATAGLGAALVGFAPTVALAMAGNALFTLGTGAYLPLYMTMPMNRVAPASRGAAIGAVQVSMYLGAFVNPLVLAPLREGLGLQGMYLLIGALAVGGALVGAAGLALRARGRTAPAQA